MQSDNYDEKLGTFTEDGVYFLSSQGKLIEHSFSLKGLWTTPTRLSSTIIVYANQVYKNADDGLMQVCAKVQVNHKYGIPEHAIDIDNFNFCLTLIEDKKIKKFNGVAPNILISSFHLVIMAVKGRKNQ